MSNTSTNNNHSSTDTLIIRRPDDWHVHLRDDDMLKSVATYTAQQFGRAIVMPNLAPPITTAAAADAYRQRIINALSDDSGFTPLMTCYLTDNIAAEEIERGFHDNIFTACKLYPANATTNSAHGVSDIHKIYPVLEVMQKIGMPLLIHGEVTDSEIDIFDREAMFIERTMSHLVKDFPSLKIVFEHITTADAADFVFDSGPFIAATITPHHLRINRTDMFKGGIRPHLYCLPIAKREKHRLALRKAAISGSPKFFLGTDSAPHVIAAKETSCGCAGVFNAPYAIESYAKTFDEEGALEKLEGFASLFGPKFYGLPINEDKILLTRETRIVPDHIKDGAITVIPFHAGEDIEWSFSNIE